MINMKKVVFSEKAPAAIGPYSQAIKTEKTIYVSGQLPIDPATGNFPSDDIKDQAKQSLTNIKNILESEGYTMADVVKTTVLLADIADFKAVNEVYAEYFTGDKPARACYQAAALPLGVKVEIEAIAVK
jgi:2-iminobutanoate/2-iminopropanoate deaminase